MGKIFLRHGKRLSLIQTLSSETFQVPTAKVTEILQEKNQNSYLTQGKEKVSL